MIYFDTSFLIPLVITENASSKVHIEMQKVPIAKCTTSQWTRVEFASALARRVRMKELSKIQTSAAASLFDDILNHSFEMLTPQTADYQLAEELLLSHKTALRAGDALHIAVIKNHDIRTLYTLDVVMKTAAKQLGILVG